MEYIKNTIEYPLYGSRSFQLYFGDMNIGVLDIETTGLSPKNSAFILGGLLTPGENGLEAEQFFAESLSQEGEALGRFHEAVAEKDLLVTFNGQHFDLPFMKERSNGSITDMPYNLDLYLLVKKFSPVRKFLPNLRQKTIENYMGLWQYRKDEISGGESVDLYYSFLKSKDPEAKEKILLHNHDDIVQLYRLLKVLEKVDLHQAMYCCGFPVKTSSPEAPDLIIEEIKIKADTLNISGRQYRNPAEYRAYEYNGNMCFIDFNRQSRSFRIELPIIRNSGLQLLDLAALGCDFEELERYPACREGFLILKQEDETSYLETNHFIKLFIERMTLQWITDR